MILHPSICARDNNFRWDILGHSFVRHVQHDDQTNKGRPFPCLCPMASSSLEGSPIHSHLCRSHPNPLQESHKREKSFLVADLTKKNGCGRATKYKGFSDLSCLCLRRPVRRTIPSQHLESQVFNVFSAIFIKFQGKASFRPNVGRCFDASSPTLDSTGWT